MPPPISMVLSAFVIEPRPFVEQCVPEHFTLLWRGGVVCGTGSSRPSVWAVIVSDEGFSGTG